jgi:Co/Zn/Cd efflux system component
MEHPPTRQAWHVASRYLADSRPCYALDSLDEVQSACATQSGAVVIGRSRRPLGINLSCALMLARHRHHGGSLMRAAFLSARNDVLANVAIIGAGLVTVFCPSAWPDLIVGLGIVILNGDTARQVWQAAREEHRSALASSLQPSESDSGTE